MRWILAATALLLAAAFWLPLWSTRMESPQYHGEEALNVNVYAGSLTGDVKEIDTLNKYIGVQLPVDLPELKAGPWALAAFVVLAAIGLLLPARGQRRAAAILLGLMLALLVFAGAVAQYRLYHLGHNRGHTPLARIDDFTPPILGTVKIENFKVSTGLKPGGWAYVAAIVLLGGGLVLTRRRGTGSSPREART
jgi:copper chaperone NosL